MEGHARGVLNACRDENACRADLVPQSPRRKQSHLSKGQNMLRSSRQFCDTRHARDQNRGGLYVCFRREANAAIIALSSKFISLN